MGIKVEVMVWEDARVKTNKVHGVVEIEESELALLVANKFSEQHDLSYAHAEVINISLSGESTHGYKVFDLDIDYDG